MQRSSALLQLLETQEERTESEFERLVMQRLIQSGYRVEAQRAVGAYRIVKVGQRLAIECDGDRWHTDMILERMMVCYRSIYIQQPYGHHFSYRWESS